MNPPLYTIHNIIYTPMRRGFLYCLSNPSMPNLFKIGYTSRTVECRLVELNRATGVPTPFHCEMRRELTDVVTGERIAHQVLKPYRENPRREFFRLGDLEHVRICFDTISLHMEHGDSRIIPML